MSKPEYNTPASRLNSAVLAFRDSEGDRKKPSLEGWAVALQVQSQLPTPRHYETLARIGELHRQSDLVIDHANRHNVPVDLYMREIRLIQSLFNLNALTRLTWGDAEKRITKEVYNSLGFLAREAALDAEESTIPSAALDFILADLEDLKTSITKTKDMNDDLLLFLQGQIRAMRAAIAAYHVVGAAAIHRAVKLAMWELAQFDSKRPDIAKTPEVGRIRKAWARVYKAGAVGAAFVIGTGQLVESIEKVAQYFPAAQEEIRKLAGEPEQRLLPAGDIEAPSDDLVSDDTPVVAPPDATIGPVVQPEVARENDRPDSNK